MHLSSGFQRSWLSITPFFCYLENSVCVLSGKCTVLLEKRKCFHCSLFHRLWFKFSSYDNHRRRQRPVYLSIYTSIYNSIWSLVDKCHRQACKKERNRVARNLMIYLVKNKIWLTFPEIQTNVNILYVQYI